MKKNFWQKQIPTLIGVGILVIALVVGVFVFTIGGGAGVFAPRATAETTPKKIRVTNVTDKSFTVSFFTDAKTAGFVKYGDSANSLNAQASDDRDQLTGTIGEFNMHHITVTGLEPNKTYYYLLGTGSGATFDNEGAPFTIKTVQRNGAPSAAKTIFGNVLTPEGNPAEGSVVYVQVEGAGDMSSLVKNTGSWAVSLANARAKDGSGYAKVEPTQTVSIMAQGTSQNLTSTGSIVVEEATPAPPITLGKDGLETSGRTTDDTTTTLTTDDEDLLTDLEDDFDDELTDELDELADDEETLTTTNTSTESATGGTTRTSTATKTIVDVDGEPDAVVETTQPKIVGTAKPNVIIDIEVNSEHTISQSVTADADGNYELDLAELSENLEPGEHTVTITYTDPNTGGEVTKTQTFVVESTTQLAQANTTADDDEPFGSSNPVPVGGSTASPTPSPTPSPSTTTATGSGTTKGSTSSARVSMPSTASALPVSGSVGTTLTLLVGGLFFLIAGGWSFWIAQALQTSKGDTFRS